MPGPFTKLNVQANGPLLYHDAAMDAGTRSVIDFRDPYTWPDGIVTTPVSTTADYKTFDAQGVDFDGQPVRFDYPFPVSSGDIIVDGTKGRNIILPDVFKLRTGIKRFAIIFWFQANSVIPTGFNNHIMGFISDSNVKQWVLTPSGDGSQVINNLDWYLYRGAAGMAFASYGINLAAELFNSAPHQLGLIYEESPDGTKFSQHVTIDGKLRASRLNVPSVNAFVAASTPGKARVGCPANYGGGTMTGNFRRFEFEDGDATAASMIDVVNLDWQLNKVRMGAA